MNGQMGELKFQIEIKRKDGTVEHHELVGKITDEQAQQLNLKETQHGSDTLNSGA